MNRIDYMHFKKSYIVDAKRGVGWKDFGNYFVLS